MRATLIASALALAACGGDIDTAWQLDHDRLIAVRVTPARIAVGEIAELDGLVGFDGQPPLQASPDMAAVISPTVLASSLMQQGTRWVVTAPGESRLDQARTELELEPGAPVPLRVRVWFGDKVGLKIVWLGEHADNPLLDPILVNGVDAGSEPALVVGQQVDVPLAVDFDDSYVVNWLTSCGTMHDFDLPRAYLRVEPEDPKSGSFAVVVRDSFGGVAWRVWPITAAMSGLAWSGG